MLLRLPLRLLRLLSYLGFNSRDSLQIFAHACLTLLMALEVALLLERAAAVLAREGFHSRVYPYVVLHAAQTFKLAQAEVAREHLIEPASAHILHIAAI